MAAASEDNGPKFSKWHLAIIVGIGTPVALGAAYWYYKKKNQKKSDASCQDIYVNSDTKPKSSGLADKTNYSKNETSNVPETPLSKAKVFKEKGNALFKEGKYDKAIDCYTEAIAHCPKGNSEELAIYYQNRAAAYYSLKNFEAVINDTTKALEYNKTYVKALHRRAKAYEELGLLQQCLEDITAVCMFDAFRTESYLQLTDKVLKELSKQEAKEKFKNRNPRLPSKHYIRHYFISFSEDPIMKSVEAYNAEREGKNNASELKGFRLVIHHLAEENYNEVIPSCTAEIERSGPDTAEAYLVRGTFYLLQGQMEAASEDFNTLLAMESVDIKVRVNCLIKLGTKKVQSEKMDEALEDFSKAIDLDLNNADIYLHRGQVYLLLERITDCVKDMEKSCSLSPNFPSAHAQKCYIQYRCGLMYNDDNQKNEALKGFEDIEKNFPKSPEPFFLYAQMLSERGEFQKADSYFKRAGELDPNDPNVFVHRGILYLQWKEDVATAVEYLNKAIEMDEKCQFGLETLGSIEIQRGNLSKGLELFQKAIEIANTETEQAHLYSLFLAAKAQSKAAEVFGFETGLMT